MRKSIDPSLLPDPNEPEMDIPLRRSRDAIRDAWQVERTQVYHPEVERSVRALNRYDGSQDDPDQHPSLWRWLGRLFGGQ